MGSPLEAMLDACSTLRVHLWLTYSLTINKWAKCSSETSFRFQGSTRHCVPDDSTLQEFRLKTLCTQNFMQLFVVKSYTLSLELQLHCHQLTEEQFTIWGSHSGRHKKFYLLYIPPCILLKFNPLYVVITQEEDLFKLMNDHAQFSMLLSHCTPFIVKGSRVRISSHVIATLEFYFLVTCSKVIAMSPGFECRKKQRMNILKCSLLYTIRTSMSVLLHSIVMLEEYWLRVLETN